MPSPAGGAGHAQAVPVSIAAQWQPWVNRACELKEAIDHLMHWPVQAADSDWATRCLVANGLRLEDASAVQGKFLCNFPDHFGGALMGSWFGFPRGESSDAGWCSIPHWAVLGWVRKDDYQATPEMPLEQLQRKTAEVDAQPLAAGPTTYAIEGIPLFWAGEGKNRTQLFRLANRPRTTPLRIYPRPRGFERCVVRRVRLFPCLAVLEYGSGARDILPFGRLSIDLLTAVGVRYRAQPSFAALWTLLTELRALHGWRQAARLMATGASAARMGLLIGSR